MIIIISIGRFQSLSPQNLPQAEPKTTKNSHYQLLEVEKEDNELHVASIICHISVEAQELHVSQQRAIATLIRTKSNSVS